MYDYGYGYTDYNQTAGLLGGLAAMGTIVTIICSIMSIVLIISQWKVYKKAGKKGWAAIVPIYNYIVLLEIVGLPLWYLVLYFVPIANIYVLFKTNIELAHKFGKSTGFGVLCVFFNFICMPILAFSKNCVYSDNNNVNIQPQNNPVMNNNNPVMTNQFNNLENNNLNNQQPFMFNQNINTEINPVNVSLNNEPNNMNDPMSQVNPMTQENLVQQPIVEMQSNNLQQPMDNQNINNNQINVMPSTNEESAFKYEMPQPNVEMTPNNNMPSGNVTLGVQTQPVNSEPMQQTVLTPEMPNVMQNNPQQPLNVIPGMGETQQPLMQNPNNNPNMQ